MQKKKRRKDNTPKIIIGTMMVLGLYVVVTLYQQHQEMKYLEQQEMVYLEEIEGIQRDIEILREHLERSNDDDHIEKVARQQLRMIGRDEFIIIDIGKQ
ncbi:MAG: septum formation initiator family protein [Clostridiaceae bacterium]|nr:septum formation initiator family protein [Clostridiaceae bacterium]